MSSDWHITFYPDPTSAQNCEGFVDRRIGHVGTLCYFGYNLIEAMRQITHKQVTPEWGEEVKRCLREHRRICDANKLMDPTEFTRKFGYIGPHGIDWDDVITEDAVDEYVTEYPNSYWLV